MNSKKLFYVIISILILAGIGAFFFPFSKNDGRNPAASQATNSTAQQNRYPYARGGGAPAASASYPGATENAALQPNPADHPELSSPFDPANQEAIPTQAGLPPGTQEVAGFHDEQMRVTLENESADTPNDISAIDRALLETKTIQSILPTVMDPANPPEWTKTIAMPNVPTKAPNPFATPLMKVNPERVKN